ncbi:MAG: hypothetical protein RL007_909 [Bacteroidota bacterium]|jgi:hypothetical protein
MTKINREIMIKLKHLCILISLLSATPALQSQNTLSEAFSIGGVGTEFEGICATSSSGYVAFCGSSNSPTLDTDPGTGTSIVTNQGSEDAFLTLYDMLGNHQWTVQIGASGTQRIMDVVWGPNEIYVCGFYHNTVDFDPTSGISTLAGSPTQFSGFVARYNPAGTLDWVKGFSSNSRVYGLNVNSGGGLSLVGQFSGTNDLDPGSGTSSVTSNGSADCYYVELDRSNGNFIRGFAFGSSALDRAMAVSEVGSNIVISGSYADTVDFDPGAAQQLVPSLGSYTGFVLCLDNNLNYNWVYTTPYSLMEITLLQRSQSGNEIIAASDASIIKFNSSGTRLMNQMPNAIIKSLALTPSGELAVAGVCPGGTDMGPGPNMIMRNGQSMYIAEYNDTTIQFVKFIPGTALPLSLAYLPSNFGVVLSGQFTDNIDFNPSSQVDTLTSASPFVADLFFSYYGSCSTVYETYNMSLCPGDTLSANGLHYIATEFTLGSPQLVCIELNQAYNATETLLWNQNAENGCDTMHTITVTAQPLRITNQTFTLCQGNSVIVGNNVYSVSGTYQDIFTSSGGCDSTVNTTLTITPVDTNLTQTSTSVFSGNINATFQWIDCSNGQIIAGATTNSFTPTVNGSYACIIVENGCTDTSGCYPFNEVGISELTNSISITLSPNPTSENINVSSNANIERIEVRDLTGRLLISENANGQLNVIDTSLLSNGFYTVTVIGKHGSSTGKFQKQ